MASAGSRRGGEVYPRVCGGTYPSWKTNAAPSGLSPRVRGNPVQGLPRAQDGRSIPACAGEPVKGQFYRGISAVYPRVCGGTYCAAKHRSQSIGLSPRVRGNPALPTPKAQPARSIPACAGEPANGRSSDLVYQVYPRVCGGTLASMAALMRSSGLSPRVRGNLVGLIKGEGSRGSIPACAGEPRASRWPRLFPWVYPRVCGGTHQPTVGLRVSHGSIPACAGEPDEWPHRPTSIGVYPRVCGGTGFQVTSGCVSVGLSPRVRGNPVAECHIASCTGSIPACAGEPGRGSQGCRRTWVYPRVCGGTQTWHAQATTVFGLSPRVRGNLNHR